MIITFYSYKGGVGRTQLVANLAAYLCFYKKKKVLLMEWDLEAPGLHFFFNKTDKDINKQGLFGLLNKYVKLTRKKSNINSNELPNISKEEHIIELQKSTRHSGCIDLLPAYIYNQQYSQMINDFNWYEFYEVLQGKIYIEFLKKKLKTSFDYDYILIDSRTGISDYSGICNIQFPEINVLLVAPSIQNFEGTSKIAKGIINSSYVKNGFRNATILPLLSRFDTSAKKEEVDYWINQFKKHFLFLLKDIYQFPEELNGFQYDWIVKNSADDKVKIFKRSYREIGLNLYKRNKISNDDFLILLDMFLSLNLFDDYMDCALLDYNKGVAFGENVLFEDNVNVNIKQISLAERYQTLADHYIEKINQNEEIGKFNALNISTSEHKYKLKNIRQLLSTAFDDETLSVFTMDNFPNVQSHYTSGQSKLQKITLLIDYARRYDKMTELLRTIKKFNANLYEKNKPYIED